MQGQVSRSFFNLSMKANLMDLFNPVVPKKRPQTESEFHSLVVAGLARVSAKIGRGNLADKMGRTTRSVDKVFAGSTPDAKALWDAMLADSSVMDELAAAYGFRIIPLRCDPSNDLELAAGLCASASEIINAHTDGHRNHKETCRIADNLRPFVGLASAIIREADAIRESRA
jgi:hypothetical protein